MRFPLARVTLLAAQIEPSLETTLLESGVEVVETQLEDDWLSKRPGHYSHAMASSERLEALRATQPNAILVSSPRELEAALAR